MDKTIVIRKITLNHWIVRQDSLLFKIIKNAPRCIIHSMQRTNIRDDETVYIEVKILKVK